MILPHSMPLESESRTATDSDSDAGELTSLAKRPLSPFPAELLHLILDTLDRYDLTNCIRVNSAFCSLSLPLLHYRLLLSEDGPWPLFEDGRISGPFSTDRPLSLRRQALACAPRKLDIHPHKTTKCRIQHPSLPPLPRLDVLRIFLARTWSGARVFHTNVDLRDAHRHPETSCAALYNLHPTTLVVRGLTLARSSPPPGELPTELLEDVRHYVAVFEPDLQYFLPRNALATAVRSASYFRACLPPDCDRLTLIFKPQSPCSWRAGTYTLGWRLKHSYATSIWAQAAAWLAKREGAHLTIVNCGALASTEGPGPPTMEAQVKMMEDVEEFIRRAVREREHDDAERVLERFQCISKTEYLATKEWTTAFDAEEADAWLRHVGYL